jgi:chemotaxis protein MotB
LLAVALLPLSAACVTSGAHEQVVRERDGLLVTKRDLEEQVRLLKLANQSLDDHVAKLVDERESLLEKRESLETNLKSTQKTKAELASTLRSREEELAVTAAALVAQSEKVDQMQGTYEGLVADLQAEVSKGQILISQLGEGLRVNVSQDILFPSGSARLSGDGEKVLRTVAARLRDLDYAVAVEGHSDNVPISGSLAARYPTNWELAGARAASVVRLFQKQGVDGSRLTAVSHGATQPVADNGTPEGRARNRRIDIRLRPQDVEPVATGTSARGK